MNSNFWLLAVGFLSTLAIVAFAHRISSHYIARGPKKTKDRIWLLEVVFCGLAVTIILLADSKSIFTIFQGESSPDRFINTILALLLVLLASGFLLLLARFVDAMLGDE
jgi:hypothetical protein